MAKNRPSLSASNCVAVVTPIGAAPAVSCVLVEGPAPGGICEASPTRTARHDMGDERDRDPSMAHHGWSISGAQPVACTFISADRRPPGRHCTRMIRSNSRRCRPRSRLTERTGVGGERKRQAMTGSS